MKDKLSAEEYERFLYWKEVVDHHLREVARKKANENMHIFFGDPVRL